MKSLVKPLLAVAGVLVLSGVAIAQTQGDTRSWRDGMNHESVATENCPQLKVTNEKITEDQARDFAQQYADKNLSGFKVVKGLGYGGGYQTVCYEINNATTLSVLPEGAPIFASFPAATSNVIPGVIAGLTPASGRSVAFYSIEYSFDLKNSAAETRNLRVQLEE
jgi:hypothetical protein